MSGFGLVKLVLTEEEHDFLLRCVMIAREELVENLNELPVPGTELQSLEEAMDDVENTEALWATIQEAKEA